MSQSLRIHRIGQPDVDLALPPDLIQVGRSEGCQARIEHAEIAAHVATLDCRGGVCMLQNLCQYDVFVGTRTVPPRGWSEWRGGEQLRLSKSVCLTLFDDSADSALPGDGGKIKGERSSAADAAAAESRRKMIQLGVTVGCLAVGGLMLLVDWGTPPPTAVVYSFDQLAEELRAAQNPRDDAILTHLQVAYARENRGQRLHDPEQTREALHAYQELLNDNRLLAADSLEGDDVHSHVKVFVVQHVARLNRGQ